MYISLALPEAMTKAEWPGLWPRASTDVTPGRRTLVFR
jgi:hypothetical protein